MLKDGLLLINTCHAINSLSSARGFLEVVESLFETNQFEIVWIDPKSKHRRGIPRHKCSEDLIEARLATGDLAVEGGPEAEWSAGLSWRSYAKSELGENSVPEYFRPNQLTVVLPEIRLRSPAFSERVVRGFRSVATTFQADYGVVRPRVRAEARYRSVLGYAAGIEDIFWLNYFGPAYTRIFGIKDVRHLPACAIDSPTRDSIFIRVTESFFDPSLMQRAQSVRERLGEAFFLKPTDGNPSKVEYSGGFLFNPLRLFRFVSSAVDNSAARREDRLIADVRPSFDLSEMIGDDGLRTGS
jgi:hypothetical protein